MIVDLLVPGRLESRSGGSLYDAHAVAALGRRGVAVRVHELAGRFPDPDDAARLAVMGALTQPAADGGGVALIDGLCLSGVAAADATEPKLVAAVPRVALVHHPVALETGLSARQRARMVAAERAALATCRHVVTTSHLTARQMIEDYGVSAGRVRVVLPGVTWAPLASGVTRAPPAPGGSPGEVRLMAAGTVIPRKGYDVLMAALAQVADLPWRCDIYGSVRRDGAAARRLRRDIFRHGLARRVRVWGEANASALWRGYAAADAFVLASYYEGYGMVFSEAVARGLPIVACAGGAVAEAVGDAGLLAAPGDAHGMARHLRSMLSDQSARRRLAARSRQARARQRSWDDVGVGLAAVLAGDR